jgi:hypothetical protein
MVRLFALLVAVGLCGRTSIGVAQSYMTARGLIDDCAVVYRTMNDQSAIQYSRCRLFLQNEHREILEAIVESKKFTAITAGIKCKVPEKPITVGEFLKLDGKNALNITPLLEPSCLDWSKYSGTSDDRRRVECRHRVTLEMDEYAEFALPFYDGIAGYLTSAKGSILDFLRIKYPECSSFLK